MSELSNKLVELGYHKYLTNFNIPTTYYMKVYDYDYGIYQFVCVDGLLEIKIKDSYIKFDGVRTQEEMKKIQIAFNRLQRDLKILKEFDYDK
ncbi:MAG: hypothetical protein PUK09_05850 [Bacilli bacterium]|nr:hypothetical protein [Bacilli bacterium]